MVLQYVWRSVRPRCFSVMILQKAGLHTDNIGSSESISELSNNVKNKDETETDYEDAIKALNTLQSNAATIKQSVMNLQESSKTFQATYKYLERSGLSLIDLDSFPVIHVSGTKGKGSTCVLTESILQSYGARTGFFSSPHLISVTERFRINGKPISKKRFATTFWKVFLNLERHKEFPDDMPAYFKFLTILSFHIFFEEEVDVALLEVGIGGEYDCTNIVRNVPAVGITSLGLEHTNILGTTIEEITWQKAGIIKPNTKCYTTVKRANCLHIIEQRAAEQNAKVIKVPDLREYHWPKTVNVDDFNVIAQLNGSLSIQLAYSWLKQSKFASHPSLKDQLTSDEVNLTITDEVINSFRECNWPGRCQSINFENFRLHFDGAHTVESIRICCEWFNKATIATAHPKVLIFNATGDRDSTALLKILQECVTFDATCFVPNIPFHNMLTCDTRSYTNQDQLKRTESHFVNWKKLSNNECSSVGICKMFDNILDSFIYLKETYGEKEINILTTGSLHLLGATLLALDALEKRIS